MACGAIVFTTAYHVLLKHSENIDLRSLQVRSVADPGGGHVAMPPTPIEPWGVGYLGARVRLK